MISVRKAKHLDTTTMFTYSHTNTPLEQSERAYYLSYFIKINNSNNNKNSNNNDIFNSCIKKFIKNPTVETVTTKTYGGPYLQTQQTILEYALSHNIFLIIKKALQIMHNTFQIPRNTFQILRNTF